ncbi:MAG: RecX family transcriptional regulator [Candidatus Saccharibacteria bacterium]|nr:RecX family transcriptional regulator [Candidatus Saccharibacteria bacterium]
MKITDIKQQVKSPERYSIFVDDKFSFGLSESALMASTLKVGKEITPGELAELKDSARSDKTYGQALGLIARRKRSEWEIRDYFKRKEYEPELIDSLVERLYKSRWLDDAAFALMWVENRRLLKSTSARRITQELKAKRVSDDVISAALAQDETDENEVLRELVARKQKQTRYQDTQKLMAYLIRQGYNYTDVKQAITDSQTE